MQLLLSKLTHSLFLLFLSLIASSALYAQRPIISSFSPLSGPVGTSVTIKGTSFSNTAYGNVVYFGVAKASITAASDTMLTVVVPIGGSYTPISVTVNGLTGSSNLAFTTTFNGGGSLNTASFTTPLSITNLPFSFLRLGIAVADLNNDGTIDIVSTSPNLNSSSNANSGVVVMRNKSTPGSFFFDSSYNFLNFYPTSLIALADLNSDVFLYMIVSNKSINSIAVLKNNSFFNYISFGPNVTYNAGTSPEFIATGDIDGDGKIDVAVSNSGSQTVSIFRNTGAGGLISFAAKVDFATGNNPISLAISDFNNDGKNDIVVLNRNAASISLLKNTSIAGAISFLPKVDLPTGTFSANVEVGDLTGDGKTDLAISSSLANSITLYKNVSSLDSIMFAPRLDSVLGSQVSWVSINDLNGDSYPDLAASLYDNLAMRVLQNTGSTGAISFNSGINYPASSNPSYNISSDIDGDGKPDILSVNDNTLYVLRNKSNETPVVTSFSPAVAGVGDTVMIKGKGLSGAANVFFGDSVVSSFTILTDTTIRAVAGNGGNGMVKVANAYGTGSLAGFTFNAPPVINSFAPLSGPVGTVVNISGKNFSTNPAENMVRFGGVGANVLSASATTLTVAVPPGGTHQHIYVAVNGRSAASQLLFNITFPVANSIFSLNDFVLASQRSLSPGTGFYVGIALADLNTDGKLDIVTSEVNYFSSLKNTSATGLISYGAKTDHPNPNSSIGPVTTDFNGDGKPDIAAGGSADIYLGNAHINTSTTGGTISFGTPYVFTPPRLGPSRVCTGDFDGDGRADMVIKSAYAPQIDVCRNTSINNIISFGVPVVIGTAGSVNNPGNDLLSDDFDGDGRLDIAVITDAEVSIFRNSGPLGSITFSPKISITTGGYSQAGFTADFDGDGKLDIVKISPQSNIVSILRNTSTTGNITFAPAVSFPVSRTLQVAVADFDGDSKPDILAAGGASDGFEILKNTCTPGTISFAASVNYLVGVVGSVAIGDADNDGKPDIFSTNGNTLSIVRNKVGQLLYVTLCPPVTSTYLPANIEGASGQYQWQVNTGNGFINIANDANYRGVDSASLYLINIPSSWYGFRYRCISGNLTSDVFSLKISNVWIGAVSNAWENPANWSCSAVPDANTDVIINNGTTYINNSTTIRSIRVNPGATVTVRPSAQLTILH